MTTIETIEKAYDAGNGNWSECDWEHIFSTSVWDGQDEVELSLSVLTTLDRGRVGDMDENESAAYRLTAKHLGLDLDEMDDADGGGELGTAQSAIFAGYCELVEKREEYLDKVREDAESAQDEADEAIAAAREGDFAGALEHAARACSIEASYGDDPTWHALREALEEACEAA